MTPVDLAGRTASAVLGGVGGAIGQAVQETGLR
jgi:hypothetical protein